MAQLLLLLEIIREEASSNRSSSDENNTSLSGYSVIDSDSVSLSTNNNSLPNKTITSTARNKDNNNKKKKDKNKGKATVKTTVKNPAKKTQAQLQVLKDRIQHLNPLLATLPNETFANRVKIVATEALSSEIKLRQIKSKIDRLLNDDTALLGSFKSLTLS